MTISGLPFLLQFLGCVQNEKQRPGIEQYHEQFLDMLTAENFKKDPLFEKEFQDAFITSTPKIEKICSAPQTYPGYSVESQDNGSVKIVESRLGYPIYGITGSYTVPGLPSQGATIITDCTQIHDSIGNHDYLSWNLYGIDRFVAMVKLYGEDREVASVTRGTGSYDQFRDSDPVGKSAALLADAFVNDFCADQLANPMPCTTR